MDHAALSRAARTGAPLAEAFAEAQPVPSASAQSLASGVQDRESAAAYDVFRRDCRAVGTFSRELAAKERMVLTHSDLADLQARERAARAHNALFSRRPLPQDAAA